MKPNLRERWEDMRDYLGLVKARTGNKGKHSYSADEARNQLGLA